MNTSVWQKIIPLLENNQRFVITSHTNPDCDALGSELALAEHLGGMGKTATILNSDAVPQAVRFLDPQRRIKRFSPARHSALTQTTQVVMVLDASGGWERVGQVGKVLAQNQAAKICIDHHPDATDFVDLAVVDIDAAATAELVYDLIITMGGKISASMAQALYAAIVTDTGSFRFPKTRPQTHQITAELLRAGADPARIFSQLYQQYPLGRVRLKGHLIDSIKTEVNGQLAYYSLTKETMKAYGVKGAADLDGFASLAQEVGSVRITVFGVENSRNRVKISLRSDGSIAINQIAAEYGGGGHPSAAGATVDGNLDQVMAEVIAKVKPLLTTDQSKN
jgi:phosphoesterase RecJ-like protein